MRLKKGSRLHAFSRLTYMFPELSPDVNSIDQSLSDLVTFFLLILFVWYILFPYMIVPWSRTNTC